MSLPPVAVIVLAAGLGKRMSTTLPKVLVRTTEMPLIEHVLTTVSALDPERVVVVTGARRELVEESVRQTSARSQLPRLEFAFQEKQLGTGHAVKCAMPYLKDFKGTVIIWGGDIPLVEVETLHDLLAIHTKNNATVTVLSFMIDHLSSYGRIVRDATGHYVDSIVEAKDCSPLQAQIREVNSGIYAVNSTFLGPAVESLKNENAQGEYYLTDIVEKASLDGKLTTSIIVPDSTEVQGVNTLYELSLVNKTILNRKLRKLIGAGVSFDDPASVFIEGDPSIAPSVRIGPNVQLRGKIEIAEGVVIEGSAYLVDVSIGARTRVKFGVRAEGAIIGSDAMVGPFAHLRPGTELSERVKIGNFVETKKARISNNTSVSHLTYLGDCEIGKHSNIGAGTITCNYDGTNKHETIIGDNVFIGSNSALVAPIRIGNCATVGAGSTLTEDVEAESLALTRAPLVEKKEYKRKAKK